MKAQRLIYDHRSNTLQETDITFFLSRIEWFELLKWEIVYEDEMERIDMMERYGAFFEEDIELKMLLKMKNNDEIIIEYDLEIHKKLIDFFS